MAENHLIINKGSQPVLVVSVHSCHAKSPTYLYKRREATATGWLNRTLHDDLGYYSFIYTGFRTRCIRDTRDRLIQIIRDMLSDYNRIGVMSLHGRGRRYTVKSYEDSLFELGTLNGKTLDRAIKSNLCNILGAEGIRFDYNIKFTGGPELRIMHKRFNDPMYKRGKFTPNHDPANNTLQIAQLEFDDWKQNEEWLKNGVDQRFHVCNVLGNLLVAYISNPQK